MNKEAPSFGRIFAMVAFALSCFGLLLFLWLAFGGSIPLQSKSYRITAEIPEAATLAQEADVRLAGVNVGRVKKKELIKNGRRMRVTLEIEPRFAPIPKSTNAILRQKTLLGETYVELSQGDRTGPKLEDGDELATTQVKETVQLDEIFDAFDKPTRDAFADWVAELTKSIKNGRGSDLNDALGNLEGFSVDGAKLLKVLDEQEIAVKSVVRNTGTVFGAINEREGALRELIVNADRTFAATASRDEALRETFAIFPTFLDESKATLARLESFSANARPVINDLKAPADDLGPTVKDLGELSPDLTELFHDLRPLIREGERSVPELGKLLAGAEPLFESAHPFFRQLNPILSYLNFHQATVAGFLSNGALNLHGTYGTGQRVQEQVGVIDGRSFETHADHRPHWSRGNAYLAPNALTRAMGLGGFESFDCNPSGGEERDPNDGNGLPGPIGAATKEPVCFIQPPSLFNGQKVVLPKEGEAPVKPPPKGREGAAPASVPPR